MANETSRTITLHPFDESVDEIAALVTEVVDLASELDIELDAETAERCVQHLLYVNQAWFSVIDWIDTYG